LLSSITAPPEEKPFIRRLRRWPQILKPIQVVSKIRLQLDPHPRENGDPVVASNSWIPAYAGMTAKEPKISFL